MLSAFASWLVKALSWLAITIINFFVDVVNAAIVLLASIFSTLLSAFPDMNIDFFFFFSLISLAAHINWFVPMSSFAASFAIFCASYVTYFSFRPILKFLHFA